MARFPAALVLVLLLTLPALAAPASAAKLPQFANPQPLYRIAADPWRGSLWLGSGVGLVLLDAGAPPHQVSLRQGLPGVNVYDIAVAPDRVWVATNAGAAVYDKGDGSVRRILDADGDPLLDETRAIFAEPGAVWVGTNTKGLFRVDPATLRATPVENPVDHLPFTTPILGIGADGQELFISAVGYGLVDWQRDSGTATLYSTHLLTKGAPLYGRLLVTPDRVWVGTSGDGVVYLDRAARMMGQNASPDTSNALNVGGLAQLGEETWMATDSGMSRRDGATDTWRNWQGLRWGNANDFTVLRGRVFAAMVHGWVIYYDRATDRWVEMAWWTDQTAPAHNTVDSCDEVDGKLLFGTGGGGALLYDPATYAWKEVQSPAGRPPDILVWDTAQDGERTWIATQHGAALWDRVRDNWTYHRTDGRTHPNTAPDSVRQILPVEGGAWFAVKSHLPPAIYRLGWQPGRLAHWDAASNGWISYQRAQGLADDNVTRITLVEGKLWIGMAGGGLDVLDLASNRISHIYPTDGSRATVEAMLVQGRTLWLGTFQGLWKVDLDTYEVTQVPNTLRASVLSLAWVDGKLWVGTARQGIYSFNPATGVSTEFHTPSSTPDDIWGFCMMRVGGLLYVGTGSGVERLDLATGAWLPQMGRGVLSGAAPARLSITAPGDGATAAPGALLQVQGTAAGSPGAVVQVRLAGDAWRDADGFSAWRSELRLGNRTGGVVIEARVQAGGVTEAQTARLVTVPGAVRATHVPVLEAGEDEQVDFRVAVSGGDATGHVALRMPGAAEPVRIPLRAAGPGVLTARSPPLTPVGTASYSIELAWPGGGTSLPDAATGDGSAAYPLVVRSVGGLHAFAAGPQCPPTLAPGAQATVSLVVQNIGARPANVSLQLSGPAAAWATPPPPTPVAPISSWNVSVPLAVPKGTSRGTYGLDGTVVAGADTLDHFSCTVKVASAGAWGIPGIALPWVAVAALAAALRRRSR